MGKLKDLTGKRFGRLVVLERAPDHVTKGGNVFTAWRCRCDCGKILTVLGNRLNSGMSKSCGCLHKDIISQYENLIGNKYNRLLVVREHHKKKNKRYWECICDCGSTTVIEGGSLRNGYIKSCGCLNKEKASIQGIKNTKHGGNRRNCSKEEKRLYNIWDGIKTRCYNRNDWNYEKYGKNGISLCDEWHDFSNFQNWALNNGYKNNLTIDRIDTYGNYEPENCRWVDYYVQNNNRKNTIFLTIDSETKPLAEWARISGVPYKTVYYRHRRGWSDYDAVFTPQ